MVIETAHQSHMKAPMTIKKLKQSKALRPNSAPVAPPETTPHAPRLIGYVRVSTCEQNTNLQYDALLKAGCDPIFEDKITGVALTRTGLDRALNSIRAGDKLVVWRLDRLGRSIPHVMTIVAELGDKGASLVSIGEGFDTGNEAGELYSTILAMIAHVERRMIAARTKAGLDAAKTRGVQLGARPKMSLIETAEASILMRRGINATIIAARYKVGRATLFRHLQGFPRLSRLPNTTNRLSPVFRLAA
jgi:DNA invertase Pin-like site-specific DNA recombinase